MTGRNTGTETGTERAGRRAETRREGGRGEGGGLDRIIHGLQPDERTNCCMTTDEPNFDCRYGAPPVPSTDPGCVRCVPVSSQKFPEPIRTAAAAPTSTLTVGGGCYPAPCRTHAPRGVRSRLHGSNAARSRTRAGEGCTSASIGSDAISSKSVEVMQRTSFEALCP